MKYFMVLRIGGTVDSIVCNPRDASCVADILNGLIVGEGRTREEAIRDTRLPYTQ
jgi:hypothetical protein